MEDFLGDILPIFTIFCAVALPVIVCAYVLVMLIKSRAKERLELIKQGIVPQSQAKPTPNKYVSLRNGFLCMGIALGIIVGIIIDSSFVLEHNKSFLIITASILFFLGLSYFIFYLIIRNKDIEE